MKFFYSIFCFLNILHAVAQGSILDSPPHNRENLIENNSNYTYSPKFGYWVDKNYNSSGRAWFGSYFIKFYLDNDNDGYGNRDQYIIMFAQTKSLFGFHLKGNDIYGQSCKIPDAHYYFIVENGLGGQTNPGGIFMDGEARTGESSVVVTDNEGIQYNEINQRAYYMYQGKKWVRNNFGFDCNDGNPNIPYGPGMVFWDWDKDGYGDEEHPIVALKGCGIPDKRTWIKGDCNDFDDRVVTPVKWYYAGGGDDCGDPNRYIVSCEDPSHTDYLGREFNYVLRTQEDCEIAGDCTLRRWYVDEDGDGYGENPEEFIMACFQPGSNYVTGYILVNQEYDIQIYLSDSPPCEPKLWFEDRDGDGYGNVEVYRTELCYGPDGYVTNGDDCDDNDPMVNIVIPKWYADIDGDGFGDPLDEQESCTKPTGYVANAKDLCPDEFGKLRNGCPMAEYDVGDTSEDFTYQRLHTKPYTTDQLLGEVSEDIVENISYYDGLGRPKQHIAIKAGGKERITNLLDWRGDWTLGSGSTPFFNQKGQTSENERIVGTGPDGNNELLWRCGNDPESNGDGGWDTDYFPVDNTVGYQYSVWVKRTGDISNGRTYHGTKEVNNLSGTANNNPYFWNGFLPEADTWYLMVGVIHPHSYTGGNSGISGVYDVQGNKVNNGSDFKWRSDTQQSLMRNYLYYCTDVDSRQYLYNPILQKLDENLSPVDELIRETIPSDVVTHYGYDEIGRQDKQYLPFASEGSQNGHIYDAPLARTMSFYNSDKYENTNNPYTETHMENSPRARVLEQAAPGNPWALDKQSDSDRTVKYEYDINTEDDKVRYFQVSFPTGNTESPELLDSGLYQAGELRKSVVKDENWQPDQYYPNDHTIEEFTDRYGRTVLKRTFNKGRWHDTYSVYDSFGNLTFVLPPKLNTYADAQAWMGQSFHANQDSQDVMEEMFYSEQIDEMELIVQFSANGNSLYVSLEAYDESNSGSILNSSIAIPLNFAPALPDLDLGAVEGEDHYNGWSEIGQAYIYQNNLYIESDMVNRQSNTSQIEFYATVDLQNNSNGQNNTAQISQEMLDDLAYQYRYDSRNRLVEKKQPGKGWEYIVYNTLNQPIMTQDANMGVLDKWLFTKYDSYGRVAYTGLYSKSLTRQQAQAGADSHTDNYELRTSNAIAIDGTQVHYSLDSYPDEGSLMELHTINYYDSYADVDTEGLTIPSTVKGQDTTSDLKGLATIGKIRVLGTNDWVTSVTGYDKKARAIYAASKNAYLNTTDTVEAALDFVGRPMETTNTHVKDANDPISTTDRFTYDHMGRRLAHRQTINGASEELIALNHYDELGRLERKDVGNVEDQPLQLIDYNYNIRGWLKGINDLGSKKNDLFSLKLAYDSPEGPSNSTYYNQPLYNGNISHISWSTDNINSGVHHYSYRYDALDRFTHAFFAEGHKYNSQYNTYVYGYDRNGNIEQLYRSQPNPSAPNYGTPMDNLYYSYQGNRLTGVRDTYGLSATGMKGFKDGNTNGDDYMYDANGNMIMDRNKTIHDLSYNHLNLPTYVLSEDDNNEGEIRYTYDAAGVKLKKVFDNTMTGNTTTTEYAGNYFYENGQLKFISTPEGYAAPNNSGGFDYTYQYRDHLGNIRLSYKDMDDDGSVNGATVPVFFDDIEQTAGWDSAGALHGISAYKDNERSRSGEYAIRFDSSTSRFIYAHSNEWIDIDHTEPTEYVFSGWFYSTGPGARLVLFMNEHDETGYFTDVEHSEHSTITGKWIYLEGRATVQPNIDKVNLRVGNFGGASGSIWYDDLSIRRVRPASEIEIVEENNYYPFGLKHTGYNNAITGLDHRFGFQGVEEEKAFDFNKMEMFFRHFDPEIGRWTVLDPVTHFGYSPYQGFDNNPIFWSDPLGADSYDYDDYGDRDYIDDGRVNNRENHLQEFIGYGKAPDWLREAQYDMDLHWTSEDMSDYSGDFKSYKGEYGYDPRATYSQVRRQYYERYGNSYRAATKDWRLERVNVQRLAENWQQGWKGWDPNSTGNQLMNIAAVGIGGAMLVPLGSGLEAGHVLNSARIAAIDGAAMLEFHGTYYYLLANQKIGLLASGTVATVGNRVGPAYVRHAPRSLQRFFYDKGVHSFFRNPSSLTNIDYISPLVNYLYGSRIESNRFFTPADKVIIIPPK